MSGEDPAEPAGLLALRDEIDRLRACVADRDRILAAASAYRQAWRAANVTHEHPEHRQLGFDAKRAERHLLICVREAAGALDAVRDGREP